MVFLCFFPRYQRLIHLDPIPLPIMAFPPSLRHRSLHRRGAKRASEVTPKPPCSMMASTYAAGVGDDGITINSRSNLVIFLWIMVNIWLVYG